MSGLPRREYRDGVELSVIGMGAIVLVGMEQRDADAVVAESVERGVNYFDVAPSYGNGEAQEKLGPALEPYRDDVFLACKTGKRDAAGARQDIEGSLRALRTDRFDLYQHHGVSSMEDAEKILAPGGAMEVFREAKEAGVARYLGITAHGEEAAVKLMDTGEFDSVLFPLNFVCWKEGNFGPLIMRRAKELGVARLALKAIALTSRPEEGARDYPKCWYEPVGESDRDLARLALGFVLSEEITATVPPGEEALYTMCLDLAEEFEPLTDTERQELFARADGLDPIMSS